MRISEILKGLTALQLNEADDPAEKKPAKPSQKTSTDTSDAGKKKEAEEVKRNNTNKSIADNSSVSKRNPTKVQGREKGAHSKDEKIARKAGEVKTTASNGEAIDNDLNAASTIMKGKFGGNAHSIETDQEKLAKQGAASPNSFNSDAAKDSVAGKAADKWWDTIGVDAVPPPAKQVDDRNRPVFNADAKDNQAPGLDNTNALNEPNEEGSAQELDFTNSKKSTFGDDTPPGTEKVPGDMDHDNDFDEDDIRIIERKWEEDGKAGISKPPHSDDLIDFLNQSPIKQANGLGAAMQRANDAWFDSKVKTGARRSREVIDAENALKKQKADEKERRLSLGGGQKLSPEDVSQLQKQAYDLAKNDLTDEQLEKLENIIATQARGGASANTILSALHSRLKTIRNKGQGVDTTRLNASGTRRTSLDTMRNREEVNQTGGESSSDAKDQLALKAQAGDQEAATRLYKELGRMMYGIALKYSFGDSQAVADLHGEAGAAFAEAIKTYDPSKGTAFSTHAQNLMTYAVRDAAMADRNINVESRELQKAGQYNKLRRKLEGQGIQGIELDNELMSQLGYDRKKPKDVETYNNIKQHAQTAKTYSTNRQVGSDEDGGAREFGDTLGDRGVESEWGDQKSAMGTQEPGQDLENITQELVTGDDERRERAFDTVISGADLDPKEALFVKSLFGIGGKEPMKPKMMMNNKLFNQGQIAKLMASSTEKIADYIAYSNDTDYEDELESIQKLFKTVEKDYNRSQLGRNANDYITDPELQDDEATITARRTARKNSSNDRKKDREESGKKRAEKRASKNPAMADAINAAKEKAAKKEPVTESERMRNFLDLLK